MNTTQRQPPSKVTRSVRMEFRRVESVDLYQFIEKMIENLRLCGGVYEFMDKFRMVIDLETKEYAFLTAISNIEMIIPFKNGVREVKIVFDLPLRETSSKCFNAIVETLRELKFRLRKFSISSTIL